ncbi:MAG: cyclic nucleotide-binding domain-containing protein, partial [Actinomycetota bacterium]|nr:cyclic nucleotide-binding domain-containing protein [Actinomycetota bacterium]
FVVLLFLNYFATFVHEMGHAETLVRFGRRVKGAGFGIYFGSISFFIDSSDGLMMDRSQRILQASAGPYAEFMLAGVAAVAIWIAPDSALAPTLYKFCVLSYIVILLNLIPLLELDGYWIFAELIQVPDLRSRSLAFVQHDLWHKLRARERFTLQEVRLGLYGTAGVAFAVFVLYLSFFFWRNLFGGFVSQMWHGGAITRLLLIALLLFIAGPVIRGFLEGARALGRRIRGLIRRVRFRLETIWRVEAAEMVDALPLFDDLSEETLSELAGRVRVRTVAPGQPVVRQGERASAFYVLRRGRLEVVESDPATGDERLLRVLEPGASFGELGLAEGAPRSAGVRAAGESEVFEIDKGTFDQLLAGSIDVPTFGPSFQRMADLQALPSFAHLGTEELTALLAHGSWVNIPPGETVVAEGEVGDAFYAIGSGRVEVEQEGRHLRTMGPGQYFGEVALLRDVPRTATVRAATPVRAYRLDRDGFDRLMTGAFRRGRLTPYEDVDRVQLH